MRVKDHHLAHLREHGYVIVPNFLTKAELKAALADTQLYFPTPRELARSPRKYKAIADEPDFQQPEFPFVGHTLNKITTHPQIIGMSERLLGTDDILLSRSAMWAKYAGFGEYEQGMHVDFEGNTLVYPRDDADYRQVNMILYYTDVDETLGPTYVVPKQAAEGKPLWPAFRTPQDSPELFAAQVPVLAKAGTLLIFSMRTFHHGSGMTAKQGVRISHHMVYRGARHHFGGYQAWSSYGEQREFQEFLERATLRQREVLGFPKVGDPYWNIETIRGVAIRYPGMDMRPYLKGMKASAQKP